MPSSNKKKSSKKVAPVPAADLAPAEIADPQDAENARELAALVKAVLALEFDRDSDLAADTVTQFTTKFRLLPVVGSSSTGFSSWVTCKQLPQALTKIFSDSDIFDLVPRHVSLLLSSSAVALDQLYVASCSPLQDSKRAASQDMLRAMLQRELPCKAGVTRGGPLVNRDACTFFFFFFCTVRNQRAGRVG